MSLLTIGIKILHLDSKTKFLDRKLCVSKKVKIVLLITEATLTGTNKFSTYFACRSRSIFTAFLSMLP